MEPILWETTLCLEKGTYPEEWNSKDGFRGNIKLGITGPEILLDRDAIIYKIDELRHGNIFKVYIIESDRYIPHIPQDIPQTIFLNAAGE